jgi:hypothetical protein
VACRSSTRRLPPDPRLVSGARQDIRPYNRPCATRISPRKLHADRAMPQRAEPWSLTSLHEKLIEGDRGRREELCHRSRLRRSAARVQDHLGVACRLWLVGPDL